MWSSAGQDAPAGVTVPVDLQNEPYSAQLIERLSWAFIDTERLESDAGGDDTEGQLRAENSPSPRGTAARSALASSARARVGGLASAEAST